MRVSNQHHKREPSTRQLCFIYGASWAVRTPFALEERLALAKTADSPTFVIRLVAPRKSALAAAGHRMRIEAMFRKGERPCSPGARSPSLKAIANIPRAAQDMDVCEGAFSAHEQKKKNKSFCVVEHVVYAWSSRGQSAAELMEPRRRRSTP